MRAALALLRCVAVPSFAAAPDAPLLDAPGASVRLEAGQPAPYTGQLLSDAENLRRAKRTAACEGTLEAAQAPSNVLLPKAALVAIIIGSVVLSAAAGAAVGVAAAKGASP